MLQVRQDPVFFQLLRHLFVDPLAHEMRSELNRIGDGRRPGSTVSHDHGLPGTEKRGSPDAFIAAGPAKFVESLPKDISGLAFTVLFGPGCEELRQRFREPFVHLEHHVPDEAVTDDGICEIRKEVMRLDVPDEVEAGSVQESERSLDDPDSLDGFSSDVKKADPGTIQSFRYVQVCAGQRGGRGRVGRGDRRPGDRQGLPGLALGRRVNPLLCGWVGCMLIP